MRSRSLSNPLRCEHVFRVLNSLKDGPKGLLEIQQETKISPAAFYNTVIPQMLELGLIEESIEPGVRNVKKVVKMTEKGIRLYETLAQLRAAEVFLR